MTKTALASALASSLLASLQQQPMPQPAVALQPLAQQVRRLEGALAYLGQPLAPADHQALNQAIADSDEAAAVTRIAAILDRHALFHVEINPESRVKVTQGAARPELVEQGTRLFLVKVLNQGGVTAPLVVESPNSGRVSVRSTGAPDPEPKLTAEDVRDRWADFSLLEQPPLAPRLSGLGLEYRVLEVASRDRGQRSARVAFNVGQGTQDIGFRNDVLVLFHALPARTVTLRVRDETGAPSIAGFVIRDRQDRLYSQLSKRLAPDLPFQDQLYRADGETLLLPSGSYSVAWSAGPEY
ncbi:MAG TPA: hypothetical protein VI589_03940, partial [Vicinamibacteria bacterium]